MAQTINAARTVNGQRRRLGGFHWFLLLLTIGMTLLISAPTLFFQTVQYDASATIQLDAQRYRSFMAEQALQNQLCDASRNVVKSILPKFGSNTFGSACAAPTADGSLILTAQATSPENAQAAADYTAQKLIQQIRAAGGRDSLRRLMEYELGLLLKNQPANDELGRRLRELIGVQAFDFSLHASTELPTINAEDLNDLIRAFEVRFDQIAFELRQPDLPAERARDLKTARGLIGTILTDVLYSDPRYQSDDSQISAAYVKQAAILPTEARSQNFVLKFGLALIVGIVGGILLVLADRAIGIVDKVRELWEYRELIRNLVLRDLRSRYKNSALGYVWSLLNPLLMISIFYLIFGLLLNSNIRHFHIFLMVALLPWNYFIGGMAEGMMSVISNANLVKKVYFPREILPITTLISNLVNFMLALPIMFLIMFITGAPIKATLLLMPVIIVIESMFILGMILFLSSVIVFYRDVSHIMGIVLQLWFFITPVFYPLDNIASANYAKLVRWLNPMASIVDFYRDIAYGGVTNIPDYPTPGLPSLDGVARTGLTALIVLCFGAYVFNHYSARFGEEL
ncbi:MAG: ABC transporter permease [Chloroflexi bacterium]|nr:ABC transporter permease [Chloroflexota bacterium]